MNVVGDRAADGHVSRARRHGQEPCRSPILRLTEYGQNVSQLQPRFARQDPALMVEGDEPVQAPHVHQTLAIVQRLIAIRTAVSAAEQ